MSAGGSGSVRPIATALRSAVTHSFSASGCQVIRATRPPGRNARPMLAKAATGSEKNIAPKRLMATSNAPASNGCTCASARSNVTLSMPSATARSRARQHRGGQVDAEGGSRSGGTCRAARRRAAPAADIEHVLVGRDPRRFEEPYVVISEARVEAVLVRRPVHAFASLPSVGLLEVGNLWRHVNTFPKGSAPEATPNDLREDAVTRTYREGKCMKFSMIFEAQVEYGTPDVERQQILNCIDQAVYAEEVGFDAVWAVEHHSLVEYSHMSAPEIFLSAVAAKTTRDPRRARGGVHALWLQPPCAGGGARGDARCHLRRTVEPRRRTRRHRAGDGVVRRRIPRKRSRRSKRR